MVNNEKDASYCIITIFNYHVCAHACVRVCVFVFVCVCMAMTVTLVRACIMEDMIDTLNKSDMTTRTRQGGAAADIGQDMKNLIQNVVEKCVTLSGANPKDSQALEEALCEYVCVYVRVCVCVF